MKLIKDCKARIKGRCKKLGHYCTYNVNSLLESCPTATVPKEENSKKGKKK